MSNACKLVRFDCGQRLAGSDSAADPLIIAALIVCVASRREFPAAWIFMWSLAILIYALCKLATWQSSPSHAPWWKHAGYLLFWPGSMRTGSFRRNSPLTRASRAGIMLATARMLSGIALFWLVPRLIPEAPGLIHAWCGMAGTVLILHFGLFDLLLQFWMSMDAGVRPLMDHPLRATSVAEFWGRRWNTAFRDLANQFLFRRLSRTLAPTFALAAVFLFSGVVHDLVISIPAEGGYGLPTLYFAIQSLAMLAERSRPGRRLGLMSGWKGWLFTAAVLLIPVPLLLHEAFRNNVVLPMMSDLGALR
ncbi:MAG: membrane bound O-acyl transferase family-domain-containing protein [Planctomycetaceae bacterium]